MNNKKKVKGGKAKTRKEPADPTKDFPDPTPEVQAEKVENPTGPGPIKGGSYTEIGKGNNLQQLLAHGAFHLSQVLPLSAGSLQFVEALLFQCSLSLSLQK